MQQRVTPKSLIAENKEEIIVGYETTSKLFFLIDLLAIPISVTNNPRVHSKTTP